MASIQDILGWRNVSESVQAVETGIPNRLPPAFFSLTENVLGDQTTYLKTYGQRQTARRVEYGAGSRARVLKQMGEKSVRLIHLSEHIKLEMELMLQLRQPDPPLMVQEKAQKLIAQAGRDFRQLFDNTRVAAVTQMLANGCLYFDADGNLLPTSSGAALTIDYEIPAANRNQLNGIIGASWATDTTDISLQIENVRVQMKRNTGRDLKHAFYGKNIPSYLFKNTTLKNYWAFNSGILAQFQANPAAVPNGFFGLEWHPVADTFYEDDASTVQGIFGDDQVTFAPELTRNAYTFHLGSIAVPKRFGIAANASAALNDIEIVYGAGGYAVESVDPVSIKDVGFDTFFPNWKNPLDLFIADVTP